jgi:hypothetical protein
MEFRRVSHDVWEAMAPGWDDRHAYFEEVTRPVTERMLEPVPGQSSISPQARVLSASPPPLWSGPPAG